MDFLGLLKSPLHSLPSSCLAAAGFAVLSHLLYYIHGNQVPRTVGILIVNAVLGSFLFLGSVVVQGLTKGLVFAVAIAASYFAALYISIIIYRIFFHPLRHFPGPLPAKISKLYNIWIAQHLHLHQTEWVEKYGSSIIRIGRVNHSLRATPSANPRSAPNELLLVSVDAQQKVHGAQAKTSKKNTFYDFVNYHGAPNLDTILNREEHRWRRQVWDRAMNGKGKQLKIMGNRELIAFLKLCSNMKYMPAKYATTGWRR